MRMSDVLRQLRQQQTTADARPRLMERYAAFLPVSGATPNSRLGEGYTPLVHARNLGRSIGVPLLHLKVEGTNPTGSFKDRGMVVAVAKALEAGSKAIVCASTGNTAASAAAYGAATRLEVVVVLPEGQIAAGKLLQAQIAGARVSDVDGNFDQALEAVRELVEGDDAPDRPITLVNSVNPHRLDGQKTAAFEVCEDLGGAPDYLAIPVGNAGNISAYWQGFTDYRDAELVETRPEDARLPGGRRRAARRRPCRLTDPKTVATAIKHRQPGQRTEGARGARRVGRRHRGRDRRGDPRRVPRPRAARGHLLRAGVRGVGRRRAQDGRGEGRIDPGATIVCVLTGHGLKDPDTAMRTVQPPIEARPTADGLREALGW